MKKCIEQQTIILLNTILEKAKKCKKVEDFEKYIDKYIELYINTIGSIENE